MRFLSKIIAIFIIIVIILPLCFTIVLAEDNTNIKYLALGDSIAYGYGLANREKESYAQIVRSKQNISTNNYSNLAVSGMTCEEFYDIIQTKQYTDAIKVANLITVSIGSNELLSIAIEAVSKATGVDANDSNFTEKVKDYFASLNLLQQIQVAGSLYSYFTSDSAKKRINESIATYSEKWEQSVNYIKSINSNVTIIATEFYNPYYEVGLATYDLGSYVDEYIKKMNNILKQKSNSEKRYKIAQIYDDFNTTDPRLTNVVVDMSNFDNMNIDPHPNKNGHSVIATRILDVLKTVDLAQKKDIKNLTFNNIKNYDYTGEEIKPEVIIKDGTKILTENTDYSLTYINNKEVGKASIIIKGIGNYTGTVTKTFNIKSVEENKVEDVNKMNVSIVDKQTYTGIKITPDVEIKTSDGKALKRDTDYKLRYYDNINVGSAKIEITGIGNYNGTKTITFEIIPKQISATIIKDITDQKYTGEEIKPKVQITDGSSKLVEDKDYEVSYDNNIETGVALIKIIGKGNYTGTTNKSFRIIQEQINPTQKDISTLQIANIEDKIYTGKVITPEVDISDGDVKLIKDQDYKLSFEDNLNIGVGKVTITGIGDYTNEVIRNFNIVRKDINYTQIIDIKEQLYTGKEIKPEVIITSDFIKLKENVDYTIEYDKNTDVGTASITINGINNYIGKTVKTFNIVSVEKEDDKNNNVSNNNNNTITTSPNIDNTVSPQMLPYTGIMTLVVISMIVMAVSGAICWFKYYRNRDI